MSKKKNAKREKQIRYLSQAIQLEEAVNPHIVKSTMIIISLCLISFIIWAGFTNINEIARTSGEIVPLGYHQTVQHLEGGVIQDILVKDGDAVKIGQTILRMDNSIILEDRNRVYSKQLDLELQAERLRAFIEGRIPDFNKFTDVDEKTITDQKSFFDGMVLSRSKEQDITREQIEEKIQILNSLRSELETAKTNLLIAKNIYEKRKILNAKGYSSDMQLMEDERLLSQYEGEIKQLNNRIISAQGEIEMFRERNASLIANHRDEALERLANVTSELAQNTKLIEKLDERMLRSEIKSPSAGLVQGLAVNTVGAVIQPGQTLMEIVPIDKELIVAVNISPKDIGHIKIGQPVQVKLSSFDFSRYGSVRGILDQISATTFTAENGERFYQGRIILEQNYVGNNPTNIIIPGMTVMADIITGKKTILQYMLKPVHLSLKTAFTER